MFRRLGSVSAFRARLYLQTQLRRFHLKTETESSLRNVVLNKIQDDV
jgi:hypothetical protein